MDTNRLRYFSVIAQTGSLAKASEILRVSSPALSKAMNVLEAELGKRLFVPVGRGITITDEGKELLPRAEKILLAVEELTHRKRSHNVHGTLRLGSFEVFSTYFLGPLIEGNFQDCSIELHELIPGELEMALVDGRVDIGITYIPIPRPELEFLKAGTVKMGIYGLSDAFKKENLEELPFAVPITPISGAPTKVQGLDGWPEDRLPRFQKYKVTLMESAMELCRQGLAVCYLPHFVVELHNRTVEKPYRLVLHGVKHAPVTRQDVYVVTRRGTIEDDRIKKITKAIRVNCRERES